ncbi:TPA: thioesterase family protein, partial [Yersinia enterocolitica]|nr:thioesterase family protein [Yersinia enterocolitica]
MPVTPLTLESARNLIGEIFVYHMPFNRELGLKLTRFEQDFAEITFDNNDKLVGNIAQRILHGGVIAA